MLQARRLGYVALEVTDLEGAARFYQEAVNLEVTERLRDRIFLTGGTEHHWLELRQSDACRLNRVGFEVENQEELEAFAAHLEDAGVEVASGGDLQNDRIESWIRCRDPDGNAVELFVNMISMPVAPAYAHLVHMQKLLHFVLAVRDIERSHHFYSELLGFQDSDWIERRAVFLRCRDRYHHSLALFGTNGARAAVDHFCILVPTLDDLMRARARATALGVPFRSDLIKHAPSGSIAIYLRDQANDLAVEFCYDHKQILDDEGYRPRLLPARPDTLDMWIPSGLAGPQQAVIAPGAAWRRPAERSLAEVLGIEQAPLAAK
jgi:2,3-dihydroxy-p-cumate/2,3-dihydroxybenzoate 3,4-dioxygenase